MSNTKTVHSVLQRPRITEKAALASSTGNSYVFEVHPESTKKDIKKAVEKVFDVKVKSVRTQNYMGKIKRVGARAGRQISWKKAYVSLEAGSTIDLVEGL